MKKIILLLLFIPLFGCAEAGIYGVGSAYLDSTSADVKIVKEEPSCHFVCDVESKTLWGGLLEEKAYQKVINDLTHQAKAKGADTLYIYQSSKGFSGSEAKGKAYICSGK